MDTRLSTWSSPGSTSETLQFEASDSTSRLDGETKPVGIGMNLLKQENLCSIVEFLSEHRGCNVTNHDHVRSTICGDRQRIMTAMLPLIWHTCIWAMVYDDMRVFWLMDASDSVCVHMRRDGFIAVSLVTEDSYIFLRSYSYIGWVE